MANLTFDFMQIVEMSDNIFYRPFVKSGVLNIQPDTYVTVWCENNHPTTERANIIYEHLMENGLFFHCTVCKLVKDEEESFKAKDKKKTNFCEDCCAGSLDPRQDEITSKIYLDFTCYFILFVIILFFLAF